MCRPITGWFVFATALSCVPAIAAFFFTFDSPTIWQGLMTFPVILLVLPMPLLLIGSVLCFLFEKRQKSNRSNQPIHRYDPHNLY
jgi:hypothetical protein